MREEEREFFSLPFRWLYSFDSLRLRDKKKNSEQKKKIPFSDLIFLPIAGEKKEKMREGKQRKSNILTRQIVIHLVRVLPGREKEYSFCKQGKITPLLQKAIQKIEKRKVKHNTQKIIKI